MVGEFFFSMEDIWQNDPSNLAAYEQGGGGGGGLLTALKILVALFLGQQEVNGRHRILEVTANIHKVTRSFSFSSTMKVFFSLSHFLLFTTWTLHLAPVIGNKLFQFGACSISININEIRDSFSTIKKVIQARDAIRTTSILLHPHSLHDFQSLDRCCLIRHILRFYLDKVFRHCGTENLHISRKVSSIANSFLSIEKKFRECQHQGMCSCGEDAINRYRQIITNYEQIDVSSAAMKSLGELDILLDWFEEF
ncbi:interleukin-20-like [Elgaria multicarinata webbii]|uniref:interleukin-20-like n=1 Tax=Elgaria multicarinata webbii TaxID=159646 RepID=UPI002FCCC65C